MHLRGRVIAMADVLEKATEALSKWFRLYCSWCMHENNTGATREELGGRPVRVKSFGWG